MIRGRASTVRRWAWPAGVLACIIVAVPRAGEDGDHRVYRAPETIRFDRHCADATAHQVQAYAQLESEDGRARVLAVVYARHDAVRIDDIFIGMRLVALGVDAGTSGAGAHWSVRMEARSTGGIHVGAEHAHYDSNPARGVGERRRFRADAHGALNWLDFTEPSDDGDRGGYPHNWSPEMETTTEELGLSDTAREVAIDLVVTRGDSGEAVHLRGPRLWVPDRLWHERPPKPRTLGLLAGLNPLDEGGVWQWLKRGAQYGACIEERRAAKRRFASPP